MLRLERAVSARIHYAWVTLGLAFLTMLICVAVRASPAVLIVPLEHAFGWSPATISFAISLNLVLYGVLGPFGAALMQRIGIRRTVLCVLTTLLVGVSASTQMSAAWQLILFWGLLIGAGTGMIGPAFGPTIVNRWFEERRGLALGIASASSATGQLLFLPPLAAIAETDGWRSAVWIVVGALAILLVIVALLLRERPSDLGIGPLGLAEEPPARASGANPITAALGVLGTCLGSRDFWLLALSFLVCGASSSGLVGTHLIPFCFDNGIPEVKAAGLLAAMGVFNIAGTMLSGWFSDRYDGRILLMVYYGLRGLSLLYLPFSDFNLYTLSIFAAFYGLDWFATVPPMMRLVIAAFGKPATPIVYGWLFVGHQIGAASIAYLAGVLRADLGSYMTPFLLSGMLCLVAAAGVLWIGRRPSGFAAGPAESPA